MKLAITLALALALVPSVAIASCGPNGTLSYDDVTATGEFAECPLGCTPLNFFVIEVFKTPDASAWGPHAEHGTVQAYLFARNSTPTLPRGFYQAADPQKLFNALLATVEDGKFYAFSPAHMGFWALDMPIISIDVTRCGIRTSISTGTLWQLDTNVASNRAFFTLFHNMAVAVSQASWTPISPDKVPGGFEMELQRLPLLEMGGVTPPWTPAP